jgi:tetratricopeptide (TPR) repeat protein
MIFIVLILFIPTLAAAETKNFVKDYAYQASEYDSKVTCRALALEQVKRLLLEQLGTYLESETEVKNFQLTKDQIVILTAGIVSTEIIDEKWDGKTYYLKAKITADPKGVVNSIDKLRHDRQNTKDLKETRKRADEALGEVENLKKELDIAKTKVLYDKTIKELMALDWFEKGMNYGMASWELSEKENKYIFNKVNYSKAIKAFTQAIALNPKYGRAYEKRGTLYHSWDNYDEAISDFNKAIYLGENNMCIYIMRGDSYYNKKRYRDAINDFSKVIEMKPLPVYFNTRGIIYEKNGQIDKAAADFENAGGKSSFMAMGCSVEVE